MAIKNRLVKFVVVVVVAVVVVCETSESVNAMKNDEWPGKREGERERGRGRICQSVESLRIAAHRGRQEKEQIN